MSVTDMALTVTGGMSKVPTKAPSWWKLPLPEERDRTGKKEEEEEEEVSKTTT
jgi:hypothetical protein